MIHNKQTIYYLAFRANIVLKNAVIFQLKINTINKIIPPLELIKCVINSLQIHLLACVFLLTIIHFWSVKIHGAIWYSCSLFVAMELYPHLCVLI